MAFRFLSTHTGYSSSGVKLFEIRLDNDYIVLRGSEDEAGSARLAGQLALCLTEPLSVSHVKLTLSGIVHMAYQTSSSSAMSGRKMAHKEKSFFEKTWTFRDAGRGKVESLSPDNYLWPFDLVLDGTLPESVEGLKDAYVLYRLKAEISRKRGKDLTVRRPLRVVRTLGPSALELSHAMSVENVWPNKIEYSISTPSKAVVFGSFLRVDFKLIPLLKGLVIGNVATQLKEEQEFVIDPDWGVTATNGGISRDERIIAYDNHMPDLEKDMQLIEEAAEGFQFSRYLELPKSLAKCLQDCNVKGIKVRHKIKFNVQLHNPDGHVSELRANLPVSLYISESLPLNEDNDLIDQTPQAGRAAVANDIAHSAPPVYGEHQFDMLYSDVDPSGYRTPGMLLSGSGTPYIPSRNISSENLANLDTPTDAQGHVSAAALSHRLQNLRAPDRPLPNIVPHDDHGQPRNGDLSRRNSAAHVNTDYFSAQDASPPNTHPRLSPHGQGSGRSSQPGSAVLSRQTSEEDAHHVSGTATPFFHTDHMEDLAKVPSYSTAVRTPAPRGDVSGSSLPTYRACVSEPGSSTPTEPPSVHFRDSPRANLAKSYPTTAPIGAQTGRPHPPSRNPSQTQDGERRVRMMQLRGRG